jgi:hypothetical protein
MVEVPLTQGKVALIDDEDAERVLAYKWSAWWDSRSKQWRVGRTTVSNGRKIMVYLHRFILSAPSGLQVDHKNMDSLDNRRSNLRLATNAQNHCNRKRQSDNTSGFKGVDWHKNRFRAQIKHLGVKYFLGNFTTAEAAARAYDAAALLLHGEFARVNFPEESEILRGALKRIRSAKP